MSLYLCIFDEDDELDGVDVGAYSDFGHFRKTVSEALENGQMGSRFPVLMLHSDCDGEWSIEECRSLENEIGVISSELKQLLPKGFHADWQNGLAKKLGLNPISLYECFIDVDGEPLLVRLLELSKLASTRKLPILFQ